VTDKPTIYEALGAVMSEVQAVGKKDRNNQQGYDFRGIDAVVNAVGPAFRKHGIIATPLSSEAKYRDVQTTTGKPSRECTVSVTYRFHGPAGDFIDAQVPGESMDFGDKGAPKAMSVAYRIALLQVLCIPTHDPEPDAQSYERARPPVEEWDPVEQDVLLTGYLAEVEDAPSDEALAEIGRRVQSARRSKEPGERLSPGSVAKLKIAAGKRKAELNGGAH
jgi:ERF superfamily.